ncbi:hypothetical protein MMC09_004812 [Bachmanniomyces sp. S44760]|nr:hypothetical protein [Bachmanniomyces sp. S44760]
MRKLPKAIGIFLALTKNTSAACECGYRLSDTSAYYTHRLLQNFTLGPGTLQQVVSLNANPATTSFTQDFTVQDWLSSTSPSNPLPRQNFVSNVWIEGEDLVLRQEGYSSASLTVSPPPPVEVAALASTSTNYYHGSYRCAFSVHGPEGGSVAGFFWYMNDSSEIDIEVLTKNYPSNASTIHYSTQPFFDPVTGRAIADATAPVEGKKPWSVMQEHRFDYNADSIIFYEDGLRMHQTTTNVPRIDLSNAAIVNNNNTSRNQPGGSLQVNLWANNGSWSGPPSRTNVTMSIRYLLFYYNTTDSEAGLDSDFNFACSRAGDIANASTICQEVDGIVVLSEAVDRGQQSLRTPQGAIVVVFILFTFLSSL